MYLVACGDIGLGDWIFEMDNGRPFGISSVRLRLSRRDSLLEVEEVYLSLEEWECLDGRLLSFSLSEEECLDEEWDLDEDLWEDLSLGTSRMFKTLPVVGSTVESCPGSWET